MSSSFWKKFLVDSGIPLKASVSYTTAFVDNRITESMIPDLNKSVLMDLGITIIGDVIAILKHAIHITEQSSAKKLLASQSAKKSHKSEKSSKNPDKKVPEKRATMTEKKVVEKKLPEKKIVEKKVTEKKVPEKRTTVSATALPKKTVKKPLSQAPELKKQQTVQKKEVKQEKKKLVPPKQVVQKTGTNSGRVGARKVQITEKALSPTESSSLSEDEAPPPPKLDQKSKKKESACKRTVLPVTRQQTTSARVKKSVTAAEQPVRGDVKKRYHSSSEESIESYTNETSSDSSEDPIATRHVYGRAPPLRSGPAPRRIQQHVTRGTSPELHRELSPDYREDSPELVRQKSPIILQRQKSPVVLRQSPPAVVLRQTPPAVVLRQKSPVIVRQIAESSQVITRKFTESSSSVGNPIITRHVTSQDTSVTSSPVVSGPIIPTVTRVVMEPIREKPRCVSPDSTTDFPLKSQQKTTVILNTKGKCSVRPVSPPADMQVDRKQRKILPRADGKSTLSRVVQRHLDASDVRTSSKRMKSDKEIESLSNEKFNSFRSDAEAAEMLGINKFRSEDDEFDVLPTDNNKRVKLRASVRARSRSLSGGRLNKTISGRLGSSPATVGSLSSAKKLGGVAARLFNKRLIGSPPTRSRVTRRSEGILKSNPSANAFTNLPKRSKSDIGIFAPKTESSSVFTRLGGR